jgi:peptidoglycan/LPS O-acetylase OafA/YrhL
LAAVAAFSALATFVRLEIEACKRSIAFRGAVALANNSQSLTQNILLETNHLNPFQWSIAIELVGSIVMPLLYLLGLIAFRTYCFLALLYAASVILPLGQPITTLDTITGNAARTEYIFCMMVGSLLVFSQTWLIPLFQTKRRHILAVGAVIVLLLTRWFIPDFRSAVIVEICAASTIVFTVYYFDTGPLQTICRHRIIKFYGMISYSFYSNSILAIRVAGPLTVGILGKYWVQGHGLPATLLAIVVALTINTPVSWLTYRFVELPLTNMGRQIGGIIRRRYAEETQPVEIVP